MQTHNVLTIHYIYTHLLLILAKILSKQWIFIVPDHLVELDTGALNRLLLFYA